MGRRNDYMDAYTEVGGRATQEDRAEVIGRVESGTETGKMSGTNFPD